MCLAHQAQDVQVNVFVWYVNLAAGSCMAESPVELHVAIRILRSRFQRWLGFESGRLEITAVWKDAHALTAAAPSGEPQDLASGNR